MVQQKRQKTYIIAEVGVNHNGSLKIAKKMVDTAAEAGVDAVKFQMFKTDKLVTTRAPMAEYQKEASQNGASFQYEMLKQLELKELDFLELKEYCQEKKLDFLVTPFDEQSLEFLAEQCRVQKLKISSGDLTNAPFLLQVSQTGLPVILSTGMGTLSEIEQALKIMAFGYLDGKVEAESFSWDKVEETYFSAKGQEVLQEKVVLLQCTTEYPASFEEVNLRAMETMKQAFFLPVGYSDHTVGIAISIAAVALGAHIIEKHFTLDRLLPGPDHKASLEPNELQTMCREIRQVEKSLGATKKIPGTVERENRVAARKSLVAAAQIMEGDFFTKENLTVKRPGNGVSPEKYWDYLGKRALKNYEINELI